LHKSTGGSTIELHHFSQFCNAKLWLVGIVILSRLVIVIVTGSSYIPVFSQSKDHLALVVY
jgi:hypothetical protein